MSEKKGNTESTVLGLPEVHSIESQSTLEPLQPVLDQTAPSLAPVMTPPSPPLRAKTGTQRAHALDETMPMPTAAPPRSKTGGVDLSETILKPTAPPRSKTGGVEARLVDVTTSPGTANPLQRSKTGGAIPQAQTAPRRQSRVAQAVQPDPTPTVTTPPPPQASMGKVAGITAAVCLVLVATWVFWPSKKPARPRQPLAEQTEPETESEPVEVAPKPTPKPVVAAAPVAPKKPTFALDAKTHVIDPYAVHLDDLELDPAHKYRLTIAADDARLGTALARLDEKAGWGVMRKMASHATLQFGGAKALRMHCEPGTHFTEGQLFPLELVDLATKKKRAVPLNPALHCWDFEAARTLALGEGVKKRVRVPTDSKVVLGEKVALKVAYVLEALGEPKRWRTGVLEPGESLVAEGRLVRFALLDPYSGDNDGTLDLELLSGDTEGSGLVTPSSASGAQFVPVGR